MDALAKEPTFWTAVAAIATVMGALGAFVAVIVARHQLREVARQSGTQAVFALYAILDDKDNRALRRKIWQEISRKDLKDFTDDDWGVVERAATVMDVVGTILKHNLVQRELILERYSETILPLWDAMNHQLLHRRQMKGGFGWQNFEWLANESRAWSQAMRKTDNYARF